MRQSSIDASLGQMEVWVDNDTTKPLTPARLAYRDPRLAEPLLGERLRTDPSRSERGYPLILPRTPACDDDVDPTSLAGSGRLTITRENGDVTTVEVEDVTDVVGRYLTTRCEELALARVADVAWSARVPLDRPGRGAVGTLTLVVRPTGEPGHRLVVDGVAGSHLLASAAQPPVWAPHRRIDGDGPVTRIHLPLAPTRCDDHAFMEGGGATAFRVAFRLDGQRGEILLRMSQAGAAAALDFARESCGLG